MTSGKDSDPPAPKRGRTIAETFQDLSAPTAARSSRTIADALAAGPVAKSSRTIAEALAAGPATDGLKRVGEAIGRSVAASGSVRAAVLGIDEGKIGRFSGLHPDLGVGKLAMFAAGSMKASDRAAMTSLAARQKVLGEQLAAAIDRPALAATTDYAAERERLYRDGLREITDAQRSIPRPPAPATAAQLDRLIDLAEDQRTRDGEQQRIMAEMATNSARMLELTTTAQADARHSRKISTVATGATVLALFVAGDVPMWQRVLAVAGTYSAWRYGPRARRWLRKKPLV